MRAESSAGTQTMNRGEEQHIRIQIATLTTSSVSTQDTAPSYDIKSVNVILLESWGLALVGDVTVTPSN